ncbi:hypothetical protein P2E05_02000 [Providencia stuartii]|uniref:hypothetical protein n=1 Tax=Providencia stuartii TaxID=588 RepID=UPI0023E1BD6E|nr:hypothetical protein [Providencia stuartii]ELR5144206.1 hypothetical protein [Providencia stuartii]WER22665.1 hypothetical protein P2E04_02000 [Providencia stuartii]WER26785.1 hypothetical protein P2E05_02000 [Providencia stuartii]WER30875.1 hypothetical protein P2E06_02000 [Providencia stuartii]
MVNKFICHLSSTMLISVLSTSVLYSSSASAFNELNAGTATLELMGIIDLDDSLPVGTPYYLDARLLGPSNLTFTPPKRAIYSTTHSIGVPTNQHNYALWSTDKFILALTTFQSDCRVGNLANDFVKNNTVLGQGKKFALRLTHVEDSSLVAYVVPALKYDIQLDLPKNPTPSNIKSSYSGYLTETPPSGLISESPLELSYKTHYNICFRLPQTVVMGKGGSKSLTFSVGKPLEVYLNKPPRPGNFVMVPTRFFLSTQGADGSSPQFPDVGSVSTGSIGLNIRTSVKIVRACNIKNATNTVINKVMGRENAVYEDSKITFSCTQGGNPLFVSAIPREGEVDASNNTKLMLTKTDAGEVKDRPWLMAKPYLDGSATPTIDCNAPAASGLLPFDNSDLPLNQISADSQVPMNLNIRWAMCSKDTVAPGKYKGRVEVLVFSKI